MSSLDQTGDASGEGSNDEISVASATPQQLRAMLMDAVLCARVAQSALKESCAALELDQHQCVLPMALCSRDGRA